MVLNQTCPAKQTQLELDGAITFERFGTAAAWGDTAVRAAFINDEGASYESPVDSSDVGTYGYRLDLEIWFKE